MVNHASFITHVRRCLILRCFAHPLGVCNPALLGTVPTKSKAEAAPGAILHLLWEIPGDHNELQI